MVAILAYLFRHDGDLMAPDDRAASTTARERRRTRLRTRLHPTGPSRLRRQRRSDLALTAGRAEIAGACSTRTGSRSPARRSSSRSAARAPLPDERRLTPRERSRSRTSSPAATTAIAEAPGYAWRLDTGSRRAGPRHPRRLRARRWPRDPGTGRRRVGSSGRGRRRDGRPGLRGRGFGQAAGAPLRPQDGPRRLVLRSENRRAAFRPRQYPRPEGWRGNGVLRAAGRRHLPHDHLKPARTLTLRFAPEDGSAPPAGLKFWIAPSRGYSFRRNRSAGLAVVADVPRGDGVLITVVARRVEPVAEIVAPSG